jgi:nucleoside phosphorylase
MVLLQGSYRSADRLERFSVEVCDYLESVQPVLYILNAAASREYFRADERQLLRQLSIQGLRKLPSSTNVRILAETVAQFRSASTAEDWLSILGTICGRFSNIFIVIDLDALRGASNLTRPWPAIFQILLTDVKTKSPSTCLHIMLLGSHRLSPESGAEGAITIAPTKATIRTPRNTPSRDWAIASVPLPDADPESDVDRTPEASGSSDVTHPGTKQLERQGTGTSGRPPVLLNVKSGDGPAQNILKSEEQRHGDPREFKIAIICALTLEADAVEAIFDDHWNANEYEKRENDSNAYSVGRIGRHKVVLVHMPSMGKGSAANVIASCQASFPCVRLALVVGICGGVPFTSDRGEILLGDIVISDGIVLYDFGRQFPDGFRRKDGIMESARKPSSEIRSLLTKLKGLRSRNRLQNGIVVHLEALRNQMGILATYPGAAEDKLFEPAYHHRHQAALLCNQCMNTDQTNPSVCEAARISNCDDLKCDVDRLVPRQRHREIQEAPAAGEDALQQPMVHFGNFASGDMVMKSGLERDRIAARENIVAFEMEGAGVWDNICCLIIKGVCDYSDSHKNKKWQRYAAATAAACLKAFLDEY